MYGQVTFQKKFLSNHKIIIFFIRFSMMWQGTFRLPVVYLLPKLNEKT